MDAQGGLAPTMLHFSHAAHAAWVETHDRIERKLAGGGNYAAIRDCAAKAAENIARLAALLHVLDHGPAGAIDKACIESASRIVNWHLHEACRLRADLDAPPDLAVATRFDAWLRGEAARTGDPRITSARIYQYGPGCVRDGNALRAALALLKKRGRARVEQEGRLRSLHVGERGGLRGAGSVGGYHLFHIVVSQYPRAFSGRLPLQRLTIRADCRRPRICWNVPTCSPSTTCRSSSCATSGDATADGGTANRIRRCQRRVGSRPASGSRSPAALNRSWRAWPRLRPPATCGWRATSSRSPRSPSPNRSPPQTRAHAFTPHGRREHATMTRGIFSHFAESARRRRRDLLVADDASTAGRATDANGRDVAP